MLDAASWDHDACDVGLIADRRGRASHEWLARGLEALTRLTHRGATGRGPHDADFASWGGDDGHGPADGAGVLTAIPWLLIDHRAATGSALAARLLERWPEHVMSFCRVAPKAAAATIIARPVVVPARMRA